MAIEDWDTWAIEGCPTNRLKHKEEEQRSKRRRYENGKVTVDFYLKLEL